MNKIRVRKFRGRLASAVVASSGVVAIKVWAVFLLPQMISFLPGWQWEAFCVAFVGPLLLLAFWQVMRDLSHMKTRSEPDGSHEKL